MRGRPGQVQERMRGLAELGEVCWRKVFFVVTGICGGMEVHICVRFNYGVHSMIISGS
jgi:hypothetical protein